ncbi:MAG: IS481 family transposase [Mycobacteriaceae bacterium]
MNIHRSARTTFVSRVLLVERVRKQGWSIEETASAFGISTTSVRKWLKRFDDGGSGALLDRSSKPHRQPLKTSHCWEGQILELRSERMTVQRIAHSLGVPKSTVARVLARNGQSRLPPLHPPPPVVRYEWKRPGELVHLDVKKLAKVRGVGHRITGVRGYSNRGIGWEYVHVCIDDCTRLAYVEVLHDEKGPTAAAFLRRALAWYQERGIKVRRVMTDNGSCYVSRIFAGACRRLKHIRTRPYTPRTNGKAERFIQTLQREWAYGQPYPSSKLRTAALRPWLRYYNEHRPHGSLNSSPPISRLQSAA